MNKEIIKKRRMPNAFSGDFICNGLINSWSKDKDYFFTDKLPMKNFIKRFST